MTWGLTPKVNTELWSILCIDKYYKVLLKKKNGAADRWRMMKLWIVLKWELGVSDYVYVVEV